MSIDAFNLAAIQDVPLTAVHVPRDELGTEAVYVAATADSPAGGNWLAAD
jgi:DNA-binding LacI/PurR family transcriptional regulator